MAVIDLTINGELHRISEGTTLEELLRVLGVRRETVVVERNGLIIGRNLQGSTFLEPDDRLEIMRFVAGG